MQDNKDYLINIILPKLQEIVRDTLENRSLSVTLYVSYDCEFFSVSIGYYDENGYLSDVKSFGFYSVLTKEEIDEVYRELTECIKNHTA